MLLQAMVRARSIPAEKAPPATCRWRTARRQSTCRPGPRGDLSAQFPVQRGRLVAQLAHVAADDDAAAGGVELAEQFDAARIAVGLEL